MNDFNAHDEACGYAPALDYLNSANYNSGDGGTTESRTYDAAGNRLSDSSNPGTWSYDNLNRMTASPGLTYSNDILGDRLSNSATSNGWDQLCRMTSFTSGSTTTNYTYRSDGMRALKSVASGNSTSFAYDGQMGFEDVDAGSNAAVTDYAIAARGIDRLAKTSGGTTSVGYPLYDGHGNMVSTLSESGASYSTGNGRQYDAWGNILNSDGSGDPKVRYCANLGHKQDDESGLIYMRARYCDPLAGRFVSEDPDDQGLNWFVYCTNEPITHADYTGRSAEEIEKILDMMLQKGFISRAFWRAFMDRSTGIRQIVHDAVTDEGFSQDEVMDEIQLVAEQYESGESLETPAEPEGDIEAGEDISELLLEEETLIIETTVE